MLSQCIELNMLSKGNSGHRDQLCHLPSLILSASDLGGKGDKSLLRHGSYSGQEQANS